MTKSVKRFSCGSCRQLECMARKDGAWKAVRFPARAFGVPLQEGFLLLDGGYPLTWKKQSYWGARLYNLLIPAQISLQQAVSVQLEKAGISAEKIRFLFLSHFHVDHLGALAAYPSVPVLCSRKEYFLLRNLPVCKQLLHGFFPSLLPSDFDARLHFIEDFSPAEDFFGLKTFCLFEQEQIYAVHLPGHTHHQYGLFLKKENLLLAADAAWCSELYTQGILPSRLALAAMADKKQYMRTAKCLQNAHQAGVGIWTSHGDNNV